MDKQTDTPPIAKSCICIADAQQKWVRLQYLLVLVDKNVNIKNSHSRGGFNEDDVVVCDIAGLSATERN